jgi:cellobiose PTS system EIIC component
MATKEAAVGGFQTFLEEKLFPPLIRIAEQRHVNAIRNGMLRAIPFIVIGSFLLIVAYPPLVSLANAVAPYQAQVMVLFNVLFGLMALWMAFSISYALAESYNMDGVAAGLTSAASFILAAAPVENGKIDVTYLGGQGTILAVIIGLLVPEVMRFFKNKHLVIKLPDGVPPAVGKSFEQVTYLLFIALVVWFVRVVLNFNLPAFLVELIKPLVSASETLPAIILIALIQMIFWSVGIHGWAIVVWGILAPVLAANLQANAAAYAAGTLPPHILTETFLTYANLGGAGSTWALTMFYVFLAKSKHLKAVGRVGLIPAILTINEPILFGTPVVLNPPLLIPLILAPVVNVTIAYFAFSTNLVTRVIAMAPYFTIPAPISYWISSAFDWKVVILWALLIVVSGAIWYPFFRAYDNYLAKQEANQALVDSPV